MFSTTSSTRMLVLAAGAGAALAPLASAGMSFNAISSMNDTYLESRFTAVAPDGDSIGYVAIKEKGVQVTGGSLGGELFEYAQPDGVDISEIRDIIRWTVPGPGDPIGGIGVGLIKKPVSQAALWETTDGVVDHYEELTNPWGYESVANTLSTDAGVVGGIIWWDMYGDGVVRPRAVTWLNRGPASQLPLFGQYDMSEATGVSHDGSVIVGYAAIGVPGAPADEPAASSGAIWYDGSDVILIDNNPNDGLNSAFTGISGDGRIGSVAINRPGVKVAAAYDLPTATFAPLHDGDSDGDGTDDSSEALALSYDGSLIGGWVAITPGAETATLWTWDGSSYIEHDALSYLTSLGLTGLDGWHLSAVTGLSDDGSVIAGWGINPTGAIDGWVATVPAPGSVALFSLGGALAVRRRAHLRTS